MKINKSLILKIMNFIKTIAVWILALAGSFIIFALLLILYEWWALIFPYLIFFSIFATERIKRYATLKYNICRFCKYITVFAGCVSIACITYGLISMEKKETSVEIATYPVSPPQQDKNKENFNTLVKLTIEQAANAGNDDARFLLGQCYELLNTPQNMQTVLAYYRSSNSHAARNILDQYKIVSVQGMNDVTFRYRINWRKETFIFDFMWEENIFCESEDGELVDKTIPKSISIEAQVQNLCFVEEIWADKNNNKIRLTLIPGNFDGENFDWRTKLLDLKGDGDFRYLIIADYHTGTAPDGCIGYVIDVKDSFKHIATIPVGESFDLPYYNPLLILNK